MASTRHAGPRTNAQASAPDGAPDGRLGLSSPESTQSAQTPPSAHPQAIDQDYLTSWNNKQAPGYRNPATAQQFSSIYRSNLLDTEIQDKLRAGGGKMSLTDLVNAMGDAGTQDLRGTTVLPYLLAVIGHPRDPGLAQDVAELRTWLTGGAHRINRSRPGASGTYQQGGAVRITDAWWPLLVRAQFGPVLGSALLGQVQGEFPIDDMPGHGTNGPHVGSAFDVGFYGIVQKDLRAVLHRRVAGPLNRAYCGRGSMVACRAARRLPCAPPRPSPRRRSTPPPTSAPPVTRCARTRSSSAPSARSSSR